MNVVFAYIFDKIRDAIKSVPLDAFLSSGTHSMTPCLHSFHSKQKVYTNSCALTIFVFWAFLHPQRNFEVAAKEEANNYPILAV